MAEFYIANTDNDWFDFLSSRQPLDDVNFWKPSPQVFKAIDEGQLFVFRLKAPRNVIGGYGILASSINVPIQVAWDSLGERNGVSSMDHMVRAIRRYRSSPDITSQTLVGCRVLANPVFFHEREWFDIPTDWSSNIVTGKVYDTASDEGSRVMREIEARTATDLLFERAKREFEGPGFEQTNQAEYRHEGPAYGNPILMKPRRGQGAFRVRVASAYSFQCALSDTKVTPALEAAHIRPYADGGTHQLQNGLFLRRDIHSVLDAGYATISDELQFHVSSKISAVFNNGNEYKRLHGAKIRLPADKNIQPNLENIRWHQTERYVGD